MASRSEALLAQQIIPLTIKGCFEASEDIHTGVGDSGFDALHVTPLSWGHQELMRRDNVPCAADAYALRSWLGRAPKVIARTPTIAAVITERRAAIRTV